MGKIGYELNFITSDIDEDDESSYRAKLKLGGLVRSKTVSLEALQHNYAVNRSYNGGVYPEVDLNNLDGYFSNENFSNGLFSLQTLRGRLDDEATIEQNLRPFTVDVTQTNISTYGSLDYKLTEQTSVNAGLRADYIDQQTSFDVALGPGSSELNEFKVLPSLSVKHSLSDKTNIKAAFSKTYTQPQYKEKSLFRYVGVINTTIGNQDLYSSDNYNLDVRWENYPAPGQLISVTAFGKIIQNPINNVNIASASSNEFSLVNSGDKATVAGLEVELKTKLFDFSGDSESGLKHEIGITAAGSYIYTNQDLDSKKIIDETKYSVDFNTSSSQITGASPYLASLDLVYQYELAENKKLSSSLGLNYFSDRVWSIGTRNRGNIIEKGFASLDFSVKTQLSKKISLSFAARNLLNPRVIRYSEGQKISEAGQERYPDLESIDGGILLNSYRAGRTFNLSIKYSF
jgi:outer membrane receptor protein involved in Fe transport